MIVRRVAAVIAGVILANVLISGWEILLQQMPFGHAIDPAGLAEPGAVAAIPFAAKAWMVAGWALGAFAGALLAWRIERGHWTGWIVGGFVAAAGIANVTMIPHPFWMQLCAVALPFVGALFAYGASRRWRAADLHLRG